jgi:hypothetical protein
MDDARRRERRHVGLRVRRGHGPAARESPRIPSGMKSTAPTRIAPTIALPAIAWSAAVDA